MNKHLKLAVAILSVIVVAEPAFARGGGSNFMNSYGYQRRLQESRGFVTTHSNGYAYRGPAYYSRHRDRR